MGICAQVIVPLFRRKITLRGTGKSPAFIDIYERYLSTCSACSAYFIQHFYEKGRWSFCTSKGSIYAEHAEHR